MFNRISTTLLSLIVMTFFNTSNAQMHHHASNGGIEITDPWVRSAPPNAPALGLFMQIHNHSDNAVKLKSVHTAGYGRIELHRTIESDGMMKMVRQDFMPIAAHNQLTLKPGSWHVMLIDPEKVPSMGEVVNIQLNFDNGMQKNIDAKVRKGKMMHHNMHKQQHKH